MPVDLKSIVSRFESEGEYHIKKAKRIASLPVPILPASLLKYRFKMELKEAITKGFEKLESLTECNWPDNKRVTREKLIEAYSQTEVKPYEYLGYMGRSGLSRIMGKSIKDINNIGKNQGERYRIFLLRLIDLFSCYGCHKVQSITEDCITSKDKNLCKTCSKQQNKAHKDTGRQHIIDYLKDNPCKICAETDPALLDFHHRDPDSKVSNVACLTSSHEKLKAEMYKCDILCANCHRKYTAKQQGWYKNLNL